ncbi:gibberellin 20 oxidase 2 isoform X2 [Elaeis guineensis]|uniref:gibberellin 20 oxidase 2 isoform X2 n=1 Tax=Elaeis guineensis var. tenera TaxID=51953 RepID=UPI003C6D3612
MEPTPTSILLCPPLDIKKDTTPAGAMVFDSTLLRKQSKIPQQFIWPPSERPRTLKELNAPVVDLHGFLRGDEASTLRAAELIRTACTTHGFFQVTNHGVDISLTRDAFACMDQFFTLPLGCKLRAKRKPGSLWGYAGAHADRFSSKLPWKETLSFGYHDAGPQRMVVDYFTSVLGTDLERMGLVYQRYCEAMKELSLVIMEILAISLGVDRSFYRQFFEDSSSIMRCNYYPPCQEPELVLGTGPHCDPTSLTILQQDQVGGLEVFIDDEWRSVRPIHDALVINIGDTFMALFLSLRCGPMHHHMHQTIGMFQRSKHPCTSAAPAAVEMAHHSTTSQSNNPLPPLPHFIIFYRYEYSNKMVGREKKHPQ